MIWIIFIIAVVVVLYCKFMLALHGRSRLILALLSQADGPMFAADLVEQSGGKLNEGLIYSQLNRLRKRGLVESVADVLYPGQPRLPRRLYSITQAGRDRLNEMRQPKP